MTMHLRRVRNESVLVCEMKAAKLESVRFLVVIVVPSGGTPVPTSWNNKGYDKG